MNPKTDHQRETANVLGFRMVRLFNPVYSKLKNGKRKTPLKNNDELLTIPKPSFHSVSAECLLYNLIINEVFDPVWRRSLATLKRLPVRQGQPQQPFLRSNRISFDAVLSWQRKQRDVQQVFPVRDKRP